MIIIKNLFIFLFSSLVLICSSGLNIFIHHCNSGNKSYYSFINSSDCSRHNHEHECSLIDVNSKKHNCCSFELPPEDCCSDSHVFIALFLPAIISSINIKNHLKPISAEFVKLFSLILFCDFSNTTTFIGEITKPPGSSDVDLFILYHNLKIPAHIS